MTGNLVNYRLKLINKIEQLRYYVNITEYLIIAQ